MFQHPEDLLPLAHQKQADLLHAAQQPRRSLRAVLSERRLFRRGELDALRRFTLAGSAPTARADVRVAVLVAVALVAASVALIAGVSPVGAASPAGPFTVDLTNREDVRRLYYRVYQASEGVPIGWTGNVARCEPGTVSADYLAAVLTRINYFRSMAGVRSDVVFTPANNLKAQATALIMSAQRQLSHAPPPDWKCWTQLGRDGASANLTGGTVGPQAIDSLMYDGKELGHRRTILDPQNLSMGSGSIPPNPDGNASEAQYMEENTSSVREPVRDQFVAWPPKGFVPYQIVYPRWHFSLRDADFANATVTMTRQGAPVTVTIRSRVNWAGPGVVWSADGMADDTNWPRPAATDDRISVTIGNVILNGEPRTFSYDVTVFDPAVADPARTPLVITGAESPPAGRPATYQANTIPNAIGYQWRMTRLTPFTLADGAEGGLANFDALVDNYNPISQTFAASGASSFRLSTGQPRRVPGESRQSLTLKRSIVPAAATQLTFKSRASGLGNVAAVVEVSADDGGTWTVVHTEQATDDTQFNDRVVPLGAFAGRLLKLRFRTENTGTGGTSCCFSEGWYVDDLTLVNGVEGVATLSAVGALPSFTVSPADGATFNLDVRAQFFGSGFGSWSPIKQITPLAPAVAPTITTQPAAATVTAGGTASFAVTARGTAPLAFAWSRDGIALADRAGIEGSATATLRLTAVQAAQAGSYTVQVSNSAGAVTSAPAVLSVNQPPPPPATISLAAATDNFGINWRTAGDAAWSGQSLVTHDGVDAARSGLITDNQRSTLQGGPVQGPATVSFWWKVESEATFDFLNIELDGVQPFTGISGNVDWQQKTVNVPAGPHTLQWHYSKDGSVAVGQDAGWVDQVVLAPTTAPPPPTAGPDLAAALDTSLALTTSGNAPWTSQTGVTHDGVDAARSGTITDNGFSRLETRVIGPTTVSFWWKVDSETNFDFLNVELDGTQPFTGISGNVDWQQKSINVGPGTHTIRWIYAKDGSVSNGLDAGFVDQLTVA